MSKILINKVLTHPDYEEIVSKLIMDISPSDINSWLSAKYTNVGEAKLVISEKNLKLFKDTYLDLYNAIKKDLGATKKSLALSPEDELMLSVQNNPTYKNRMIELAGQEIDIKKMLSNMVIGIETRAAQVFDNIQEDPRSVNSRNDKVLIEWFNLLGNTLEKFNKIVLNAPDQIIQHNVTVQHIDQHVQVLQEAIRATLEDMDIETSLRFMEVFKEKMSKLKPPTEKEQNTEIRMAEAKIINDTINKKLLD